MSLFKKLAGDTVLYGVPTIFGRLLNWFLVVVHTRVFTVQADLAENLLLYTWLVPLQIVFTFGMETSFFRYGSKKENQTETFNQILSFILLFGGLICTLLMLFSAPLAGYLGFPRAANMIQLMAIILFVDAVCAIAFVKLRAQNKAKKFAILKMTNIGIYIALNLFYFLYCHATIKAEPNSWVAAIYNPAHGPDYIIWANYLATLATLVLLWKEFVGFRFTFSFDAFKPIFKYAYPLMIMGLAGSINLTADRLMFRNLLPQGFYPKFPDSDQAFSIYGQVFKLSIFMNLMVQAYRYAADPLFFAKQGDKNSPALIALSTKWFTLACIVLWVFVSLNLDWIQLLIGENYRSAIYIVPILLLANLFIGLYGNLSIWYKLSDKTHFGTYLSIGAMVITVVLNIILIPIYGYLGSAITFAISSFGLVLACYYLGQKHFPVPYEIKEISAFLLGASLIIWANSHIKISNLAIAIPYHMALLGLFVAIIYWVEFRIKRSIKLK
jgi:O-antigen/teichoic acid export membrane protein